MSRAVWCETYPAAWDRGRRAGPERNQRMIEIGEPDGGRWGFWIDAPGGSRFYHRNWQSRDEAEAGRGEFAKGLEAAEERVNVVLAQVVSQFDNPA